MTPRSLHGQPILGQPRDVASTNHLLNAVPDRGPRFDVSISQTAHPRLEGEEDAARNRGRQRRARETAHRDHGITSACLGHTSPGLTMATYQHVVDQMTAGPANALDRMLAPAGGLRLGPDSAPSRPQQATVTSLEAG
jgi:hypothetical protein